MLADTDRAALDLESRLWKYADVKERAIRRELGVSPTRHYQRVSHLIDNQDGIAYAPATCARLRAIRDRQPRRSCTDRAAGR